MFAQVRVLLVPLLRAWTAIKHSRTVVLPRPTDSPHVSVAGPASDRVLIVGSGPAVGWGVLRHDIALPGALARALTARTGRGTEVDVVGDPTLNISNAAAKIADLRLWRYDAIVLIGGVNDAIRLTSPRRWERLLRELLTMIGSIVPNGARIFVVGIQPIRSMKLYDDPFGAIAGLNAIALNAASLRVCDDDDRSTFIRLPPEARSSGRYRGMEAYQAWGVVLADSMAMVLDGAHREAGEDEAPAFRAESDRQQAVDDLHIVDTAPEARYDRIVAMARQLFDTESAAFSVTDNERQWYKSRIGIDTDEIARAESFCAPTVERRGPLIVPDALQDPNFRKNPFVLGEPHVRFYAGFPVHSRSGEPIGVLCVFDPKPRREEDFDVALLHRLALQVQREVQRDVGA